MAPHQTKAKQQKMQKPKKSRSLKMAMKQARKQVIRRGITKNASKLL